MNFLCKTLVLGFLLILNISESFGQLRGLIQGEDENEKKPIYNAKIRLKHAKTGTLSNEDGTFELSLPKALPDTLIFSANGFYNDTIIVNKSDRFAGISVTLYSMRALPEFIIYSRR